MISSQGVKEGKETDSGEYPWQVFTSLKKFWEKKDVMQYLTPMPQKCTAVQMFLKLKKKKIFYADTVIMPPPIMMS